MWKPILLLLTPALLAASWESDARARIREALFVPNPLPALNVERHGSFDPDAAVTAERVAYATEDGMRVPAIVYRPKAEGTMRRPALIVVNGHGGDKYAWYAYYTGITYARGGGVVLTYDPIGEGERNAQHKSETRAHDVYVPPDEMGRRMGGLMMTDVMQAVSYLRGRPDVDGARIAAAGYSMGSFVLSLACAVETRLHACVLVGGGNLDGPDGYWDRSKKMCQGLPYQSLAFLGDRPAAIYALHALRGPTLIHNGSSDEVVNIKPDAPEFFADLQQRTRARVKGKGHVFEYGFTQDGGHRPYWVTRPVAQWLHKQLSFPGWTLGGLPKDETHISEWAAETGAEMDRSYANEHREGGTVAIDRGIPSPPRDTLNVFPEAEWSARRADFVLETWLEKQKVKIGGR